MPVPGTPLGDLYFPPEIGQLGNQGNQLSRSTIVMVRTSDKSKKCNYKLFHFKHWRTAYNDFCDDCIQD
eukprot:1371504-Amphidinium_carterae.1